MLDPDLFVRPPRPLPDRVRAMLLEPKLEWPVVATEPATIPGILRGYVMPLAAIGPVAGLIGALEFGVRRYGVVYHPPVMAAIGGAILQYVLSLLGVFVLAWLVDALAPTFAASRNPVRAFQLAAYGATASWLAGIFALVPAIGWLGLLGLYSLYPFYLGLSPLMRAPPARVLGYAAATMLGGLVIEAVIVSTSGPIAGRFSEAPLSAASASDALGIAAQPGAGTTGLASVDAATRQAEAAAASLQNAGLKPADPAQLQTLLPPAIAGFTRATMSTFGASAAGIGGAEAEGSYESGDKAFTLKITDLAAAGALVALGSGFDAQASRRSATGYERTAIVGGRLTSETWDSRTGEGSCSILVAKRFNVEASGGATSIEVLKAAVAAIGTDKLEALAAS